MALGKVLYVEDDEDIRTVAVMALETVGNVTVIACSSGQEALEKAANENPDLFLLDVMMPEMDGPTTLAELRKISGLESVPVVFMTAKTQAHEKAQYMELGAIGVIAKPFDPMKLCEELSSIWEKTGELNETESVFFDSLLPINACVCSYIRRAH